MFAKTAEKSKNFSAVFIFFKSYLTPKVKNCKLGENLFSTIKLRKLWQTREFLLKWIQELKDQIMFGLFI